VRGEVVGGPGIRMEPGRIPVGWGDGAREKHERGNTVVSRIAGALDYACSTFTKLFEGFVAGKD
jgi:hypothetical protein